MLYKETENFTALARFPPGSITSPVVRAAELKCQGQSVTLLPEGKVPQSVTLLPEVQGA
jgi:hypothetical protein